MGKVGVILSVIDPMLKKTTGAPAKRLSLAFAPVFRQRWFCYLPVGTLPITPLTK